MPKKLTIEEMKEIAASRGGFCISEKYVGSPAKLLWQCKEGHQWHSPSQNIKAGHWCPYCAGKAPSTIEEMKRIAATHGGKCLSEKYIGQEVKLLWRCKNGHEWKAIPKHIMKGVVWCPYCAGKSRGDKQRYTIEEMREFAAKKGGECISKITDIGSSKFLWRCKNGHKWVATATTMQQRDNFCVRCAGYKPTLDDLQTIAKSRDGRCLSAKYNTTKKLRWRCKEGHEWEAKLSMIKRGSWCPYCSNHVKLTIKEMQEIAAKHGGRCLSDKYINSVKKLKWECKEGHIFEAAPTHIKPGKSWCRICGYKIAGDKGKYSMEEIRALAAKKGGECLSKEYNAGDKVLWRCKEGHEWEASPHGIKNSGSWCPSCTEYVNESLTRALFEKIFDVKFMKCHPKWLVGSSGHVLELDGYNKDLGIAFEYHGEQHFKEDNYFHRTNIKTNIDKRRIDDEIKRKTCQEKEIKLLEIPFSIKQRDYFDYIVEQCKNKGIKINSDKHIDYRSLALPMKSKLQEMKDLATAKGGECLSTAYLGNAVKLSWKCGHGHVWESRPQTIKKGSWCPLCYGKTRLTIEEMQSVAIKKGGQCLSIEYINSDTKLKWRCKEGHEWEATSHDIRHGSWCPHCSGKAPLTIEEMRELAIKNGGLCLSDKYINSKTKLKWQCGMGHKWETTSTIIKGGHWCPYCAKRAPLTIKDMQNIAAERGGQCLSTEYGSVFKKLKWSCKEGHEWEATPQAIRKGAWCPHCSGRVKLTIEDIQNIAAKRDGRCLSTEYVGILKKLLWRCKEGHEWEAVPRYVRDGSWCPECKKYNLKLNKYSYSPSPHQQSLL